MKSKLGIDIGFFACICFLVAQFGGLTPLALLVGYVLIREENEFLRMSALKALMIVLCVSVLNWLIGVLPDIVFELLDRLSRLFGADTPFGSLAAINKIEQFFSFLSWIVNTCKAALLLLLAFLACRSTTVRIPLVDSTIETITKREQ